MKKIWKTEGVRKQWDRYKYAGSGGADRRRAAALAEWEAQYQHVLRVSGGGGDNGRNDPGGDGGNSGTNQRQWARCG